MIKKRVVESPKVVGTHEECIFDCKVGSLIISDGSHDDVLSRTLKRKGLGEKLTRY